MAITDTEGGRIGLTVYGAVIAVANILVIVGYAVNRKLQTSANRFVISLAVSDLLVSLIFMPLNIWAPTSPVIGPMNAFFLLASLGNICGCTYDRYNAIKNPLHYPTIMTKVRFIQVMVVVWSIPLVIALIPQSWMRNADALKLTAAELLLYEKNFVAFMTILVLVLCLILTAIYIYIFSVARKHYVAMRKAEPPRPRIQLEQDGTNNSKARRRHSFVSFNVAIKSTILFAAIGCNFFFCWLALIIVNLAFAFNFFTSLPRSFYDVGEVLMYTNSLLNPVIYAFFQKEFRNTILMLLGKGRTVQPSENSTEFRQTYNTLRGAR